MHYPLLLWDETDLLGGGGDNTTAVDNAGDMFANMNMHDSGVSAAPQPLVQSNGGGDLLDMLDTAAPPVKENTGRREWCDSLRLWEIFYRPFVCCGANR